ncbi:unnamed protein product [Penicillium egyptiacum]|uniref:Uncharacterized protein n=1 Tax=Penicillium egyptiacum TaxID=1303716 RepID=A0A9W4KHS2_9EURO|nr:unnamed protein product [Penicillium egyptiacum]
MDKHHNIPLSFERMLALQRSKGLSDYEAWRQAMALYNQQRHEHAVTTTGPAITSPELPLGESVLTSKTATASGAPKVHLDQPPVNAAGENLILARCKPDEPAAKERVRENTQRLIHSGVADKLSTDQTVDDSLFERTGLLDAPDADTDTDDETNMKYAQEAHARYWAAMGGADNVIGKRP